MLIREKRKRFLPFGNFPEPIVDTRILILFCAMDPFGSLLKPKDPMLRMM